MSLHTLRQAGAPVEALVEQHGREAVVDELEEMCYEDMADVALAYAIKIGETRIARLGAGIVLKSGSYPEAARNEARRVLGEGSS